MRVFKLVSAIVVVLAFSAVAVATASAAESLWRWLPGAAGATFTGSSGKAVLQVKGGASINCTESKTTNGEITTELTLGLATITFGKNLPVESRCTTAGLAVEGEGSELGVIKVHLELHNCLISPGHRGIKIAILPLDIKVPSVGQLLNVKGAIIAEITPFETSTKEYSLAVTQKEGKQGIPKCEGGEEQKLETSTNGGAFVQSGEEAAGGKIVFAVAQTAMA